MKKQLVIAGSVLAVVISQGYTGYTLAKEIDDQKEVIHKLENEGFEQRQLIDKQQQEITNLEEIIVHKDGRIQELVLQVEQITKEKEEVKQQLVSRGEENNKRVLNVVATAYVSFCDTGCIGKTSIGIDVSNSITVDNMRIIAVDPTVIPLYSIVRVETNSGSFIALAADKGGAIKGNKIDVLVSVHDTNKAFEFGIQDDVRVTVLREGKG